MIFMLCAVVAALIGLIVLFVNVCTCTCGSSVPEPTIEPDTAPTTESMPEKVMIENVKVIPQTDLKAGCETYACTVLFNILGFKLDEHDFADNYLFCKYIEFGDDGTNYGPDMYSAFAGSAYAGRGVYAPSMAKSMNNYLKDQKSDLKAYAMENVSLEEICREYTSKKIPVMVWATTDMDEPYVYDTWIVNYVDENAKTKLGDTFSWYMHEHCLTLVGYDKDNYYFADSAAGEISVFKKDLVAKRYEQMGKQAIVVK